MWFEKLNGNFNHFCVPQVVLVKFYIVVCVGNEVLVLPILSAITCTSKNP